MKSIIMSVLALMTLSTSSFAAGEIKCLGTEPFWSATITSEFMTYDNPAESDPLVMSMLSLEQAEGVPQDYAFVAKTKNASMTAIRGECTDGMSDNTYTHHALMSIDGRTMYGCCNIK